MKGMFNMNLKSQKTNEKQILLEIEYTNPCINSMFDAIETKAQVEYQELSWTRLTDPWEGDIFL